MDLDRDLIDLDFEPSDIYLVKKSTGYEFLIVPTEAKMVDAEVLMHRLNVQNLFLGGFDLIQYAAKLIYLSANMSETYAEKVLLFTILSDDFELSVPGCLMVTWKIARALAEAEFTFDIPKQPAIL